MYRASGPLWKQSTVPELGPAPPRRALDPESHSDSDRLDWQRSTLSFVVLWSDHNLSCRFSDRYCSAPVWRHLRPKRARPFPVAAFAGIGAGASFLSALLGSVGPVMAPFFLAYGLVKGAYIGTEALSTVVMHVTKLVAYQHSLILTGADVVIGIGLGPVMILGSFLGKRIVDRLPEKVSVTTRPGCGHKTGRAEVRNGHLRRGLLKTASSILEAGVKWSTCR